MIPTGTYGTCNPGRSGGCGSEKFYSSSVVTAARGQASGPRDRLLSIPLRREDDPCWHLPLLQRPRSRGARDRAAPYATPTPARGRRVGCRWYGKVRSWRHRRRAWRWRLAGPRSPQFHWSVWMAPRLPDPQFSILPLAGVGAPGPTHRCVLLFFGRFRQWHRIA